MSAQLQTNEIQSRLALAVRTAPKNPRHAILHYRRIIWQVTTDRRLFPDSRIALCRELLQHVLGLHAHFPKATVQAHQPRFANVMSEKFMTMFKDKLLAALMSEHYALIPGITIETSQSFEREFLGYSFDLEITGAMDDNSAKIKEYRFAITDRNHKNSFMGRIDVDLANEDVKITLLPYQNANGTTTTVPPDQTTAAEAKALMGLTYLLRKPIFENRLYTGQRQDLTPQPSSAPAGVSKIDVGKETKVATIPFKRRTIDHVNDAWQKTTDLLAAQQKTVRDIEHATGKTIKVNIHHLTLGNNPGAQSSASEIFGKPILSAGLVGVCDVNRASVDALVAQALLQGPKAVVSIHGAYVPPELEGRKKGPSPSPHVRRTGKVVLVTGAEFCGEEFQRAKAIFRDKASGKTVTKDEDKELADFFAKYRISNPFNVQFIQSDKDTILRTNGTIHTGHSVNGGIQGGKYIIRPD